MIAKPCYSAEVKGQRWHFFASWFTILTVLKHIRFFLLHPLLNVSLAMLVSYSSYSTISTTKQTH